MEMLNHNIDGTAVLLKLPPAAQPLPTHPSVLTRGVSTHFHDPTILATLHPFSGENQTQVGPIIRSPDVRTLNSQNQPRGGFSLPLGIKVSLRGQRMKPMQEKKTEEKGLFLSPYPRVSAASLSWIPSGNEFSLFQNTLKMLFCCLQRIHER